VRTFRSFPVNNFIVFKMQMLNWANRFSICCFFDNHHYNLPLHSHECLLAAGTVNSLKASCGNAFATLQQFTREHNDWIFGHLGYDLKNETEQLQSSHPDRIGFPDLFFFVPQVVCLLSNNEVAVGSLQGDHEKIFEEIRKCELINEELPRIKIIQQRIKKDEYTDIINSLQRHILRGDCYEINFCQEFFAEDAIVSPLSTYAALVKLSPNPYSAFYKLNSKYLLCASPERYLKKEGNQLISQPIKGTWPRDLLNAEQDEYNRYKLYYSSKERSENVMVVDLVRHDLSKVCKEGTVKVDELFGVYPFPQVHQMVSTISGTINDNTGTADILRATFPMGSMTGAPKKRVMELIEQYEQTKRGLFSGAVGYLSPSGNFDFNVVIRSMLYNAADQYLSFQTGSGITFYSDPEKEYEECLLKASAMRRVLGC
jgi:para-aminobenzoate synthetase component I